MNRKETKKLLDEEADLQSVKVHFVNGGEVEYWVNPKWFPIDTPSWCPGIKYRVALNPPTDIYVAHNGIDLAKAQGCGPFFGATLDKNAATQNDTAPAHYRLVTDE